MMVFAKDEAGQQIVVPEKFTMTAVIFGVCSAVFCLGCYVLSIERVQINPGSSEKSSGNAPKLSLGETLKNLVTCRSLLAVILMSLLALVASLGTSALNNYLYKDYFNDTNLIGAASTLAMLAMNSFPGVICGHVEDPVDAYTFVHVNDGNAVAMPFAKGFGWGGGRRTLPGAAFCQLQGKRQN